MENLNVKNSGLEVLKKLKEAGKSFGLFIWSILLFMWECFSWIAYKRLKYPRRSLAIEAAVIFVPAFFWVISYRTDAVVAEDQLSKSLYEQDLVYKDSLLKVEFDGYKRGQKYILDSLRREKEKMPVKVITTRKKAVSNNTDSLP